jgi:hypothetical protein
MQNLAFSGWISLTITICAGKYNWDIMTVIKMIFFQEYPYYQWYNRSLCFSPVLSPLKDFHSARMSISMSIFVPCLKELASNSHFPAKKVGWMCQWRSVNWLSCTFSMNKQIFIVDYLILG